MLEQKIKRGRKGSTKEKAQNFLDLNNQGYTLESIGRTYNLHHSNVSRAIRKLKNGGYDS